MEKVKNMFENLKSVFKNLFKDFGITTTIIFLSSIIYTFLLLQDNMLSGQVVLIRQFIELFVLGTFLVETIAKKKSKIIYLGVIASFGISGTLIYLIGKDGYGGIYNPVLKFIILYAIFLLVSIVYFNFKKSNLSFEEYVTRVCANVIKSTVVFIILAISLPILVTLLSSFVLNGGESELIIIAEMLAMGFYYLPNLFYSLYNVKDDVSNFFKFMVKTLLPSLLIAAFVIIYLYIIRILITFDVPSNEMFGVITALFVIGLPIWTMANYTKEDTKLSKICQNLPFFFIPFIVLQIYAIAVRVIEYGFTPMRYLGVMLIIFEIIYIALYYKKKEKIENILIVFLCMSVICLYVPFINMYDVSFYSQYNNLKIYKEKDILTENDEKKIRGAYQYLRQNPDNETLINNYLTQEEIEEITNFGNEQHEEQKNTEGISVSEDDEIIDVQGYSKIYKDISSVTDYSSDADDLDAIFKNITFTNRSQSYEFSIDLSSIVREYISNKENIDEYFSQNNKVMIDENRCFVITDFNIRYNIVNKLIENYSIDGYVLEK